MPAPNTSTETMPLTEASVRSPTSRATHGSSFATTWSPTPMTTSGTIHRIGLR